MKESSYELLQKKQWRAITYDWDILSQNDNISRAYCLTDFQVAWLLSNLDYFAWSTRWENCPCTESDMLAMQGELAYNLMDCIDLQPYQLQYLYQTKQSEQLQALADIWDVDPTPSSINPNTPDDYFSGDDSQDRTDALCTACKIYVYSYAQNWVQQAQIALGIVAVVSIATSITLVGGIIPLVLLSGLALITASALTAMQDESALDAVACCMHYGLIGEDITQANFEDSLDGCGFTVGTNSAIVRDIIASDIGQFNNFLTFINQLGDSFVYAENGIIDCPCEDVEWEHVFDFTVDDGGFVARNIWGTGNCALYASGNGWTTQDRYNGATEYSRLIAIEKTFTPDTHITNVEMRFNCSAITYSSGLGTMVGMSLVNQLDGVNQSSYAQNMNEGYDGTNVLRGNPDDATADTIRLFLRCSDFTSPTYQNNAFILNCTVRGTGVNPF